MNPLTIKPLLITTGEPAGIGMDVVLDVLLNDKLTDVFRPIVVTACLASLQMRFDGLSKKTTFKYAPNFIKVDYQKINTKNHQMGDDFANCFANCLVNQVSGKANVYVIDVPSAQTVITGQPNPNNASMVLCQLNIAHTLAMTGQVAAITTAPLAKSVMMDGGIDIEGEPFTGHTEYFMVRAKKDKVVMMLTNSTMKVALVTTHLPLRHVAHAITTQAIKQTIDIVVADMANKFHTLKPKILVCGLNPHAGEGGHLGDEEINIINPLLEQYQARGLDISLAMPADTVFTQPHLAVADVIIAMYHDQGLAPLKSHGFGDTVNLTLGLPYIRTSVDHGTAFDLAGSGRASSSSLLAAIKMADKMIIDNRQT